MILLRRTDDGYGQTDEYTQWVEQRKVGDIDGLVENMGKALEGEVTSKRRSYEVVEVEVVRRFTVNQRVEAAVAVDVTEEVPA